jgi:HEAT repeat protein
VAQKAAEPVPAPKPRRVDSRRPQPTSAPRGTSFADVTPEEASAAAFNSVTEKVSFARALKDLASPDSAMRARAATVMGTVAHDLSVRALTTCLARDPAAEVRKVCVHALTELGKREGLPAVERALSDSSANVRVAAVRGVYRLAGPVGASLLVQMLSDADEGVRRRAAVCIGWLGRPELTAELLPLLRSGSAWVRLATLEALENLKSLTAVDYVIALLQHPEESVQRKAFDVLRTITGRQMGETFPADEKGRQFMIARWRSWREDSRKRGAAGLA